MKIPIMKKLSNPELIAAATQFATNGKLAISANNLVYLDIDDAYIHRLFPLLQNQQIKKPDYFSKGSAGAHITVIYPEENKNINVKELGQEYSFAIKEMVAAEIGVKTYYVLLVKSPSLLQLRRKYKLPDALCFKGYAIDFHITIGVES